MGASSGSGTAYLSVAHEFNSGYYWVLVTCPLAFNVVFCRSLLVLLSVFFLPLCFTDSDYPFGIFKPFLVFFCFAACMIQLSSSTHDALAVFPGFVVRDRGDMTIKVPVYKVVL